MGLLASNVGLIAAEAPAYVAVNKYLLPLAVPLLLFAADMRRVLASTGRLLTIFCVGSGKASKYSSVTLQLNRTFSVWCLFPMISH